MSITTSSSQQSQLDVLRKAAKKRYAAEIELESPEGERQFARMRLLDCDEMAVYIDRPAYEGMPLELTSDMSAIVYFMCEGERYSFRSRIEEECQVPLGDHHSIPGFSMPLPDHVQRQERRLDYRVSLARCAEVVAYLWPTDSPEREQGFQARLMNISAGGVAAIAFDLDDRRLKQGDDYLIEFKLPKIKRTFKFRTTLRRVSSLEGGGYLLGLKYLPESNAAEMRYAIRQISQFVSKQLKKKPRSKS